MIYQQECAEVGTTCLQQGCQASILLWLGRESISPRSQDRPVGYVSSERESFQLARLPTYDAALQTVARPAEKDLLLLDFLLGRHFPLLT